MDEQISVVASVLRSCLITSRNGCPMDSLNRDYRMLEGRSIPYQMLGYPTLDAFLKDVPGIRMIRRGADLWVEAMPTKESAHISRLVANQNASRSSRRRPQRMSRALPTRRPQSISSGSRFGDIACRNRSVNFASQNNRVPSSSGAPTMPMKVTVYPPKVPTAEMIQPSIIAKPNASPTKPRYVANATITASPSKRMLERNIQPQQHLDYETMKRAPHHSMPVTVYSPKETTTVETPQAIMRPDKSAGTPVTRIPPLIPLIPTNPQKMENPPSVSRQIPPTPMTSPAPMLTGPMGLWSSVPTQNPPRFTPAHYEPLPSSDSSNFCQPVGRSRLCDRLRNGNGSIQITFNNVAGEGGDSDPRETLDKMVRALGLPFPAYKDVPVQDKKKKEGIVYGQVVIGSRKFSSYPKEAKTNVEAEKLAAEVAVSTLKSEQESRTRVSVTTMDKGLIKERILSIIDQHNGVFAHKVSAFYQELHKENLPDDWIKEVENWTEITIEHGVNRSNILTRRAPVSVQSPGLPSPRVERNGGGMPSMRLGLSKPPKLELPEEESWIVYVNRVISPQEIWVRLVGENYSDKFNVMLESMNEHYKKVEYAISSVVKIGEYYALQDDEDCHRVRVIDYESRSGEATIFFIDSGDDDTVSASKLMPLDNEFCRLPAQAIKVSLAGFEEFAEYPNTLDLVLPKIEKSLLYRVFYVISSSRGIDADGPFAAVEFLDTRGPNDVNINELMLEKVMKQLVNTLKKLQDGPRINDVHISHVDKNGDIFVQIKNEGMKFLVGKLNKFITTGLSEEDMKKSKIDEIDWKSCYLVKSSESGDWLRATFVDYVKVETGEIPLVKVFLIDFGKTIDVELNNVLLLERLDPILARFPGQAIKVRLLNVEPTMIARLTEITPPTENVLLKVKNPSCGGSPAVVELYKRNSSDNLLIDINRAFILENEIPQACGDGNNNNPRPRNRMERMNSRSNGDSVATLKAPKISKIGEYLDVHVTMAANPSNFMVQPLAYKEALQKMMDELQETCVAYSGNHPTLDSVREGKYYAAKHVDQTWYRASISNVLNEQTVTVYFCDYGDVTLLTLDKLQPLAERFFELPYQAIKARLVGIRPTNMDWSPEDCVRFQDLTVEKNVVSIVREKSVDAQSPGGDIVLGLTLIDVDTPVDIYIGRILVEEGRAVFVDESASQQ